MMAIGGDSPWTQFRVGPNKNDPSCAILSRVSHIAHFESARRIVADGAIHAGLVHDE